MAARPASSILEAMELSPGVPADISCQLSQQTDAHRLEKDGGIVPGQPGELHSTAELFQHRRKLFQYHRHQQQGDGSGDQHTEFRAILPEDQSQNSADQSRGGSGYDPHGLRARTRFSPW